MFSSAWNWIHPDPSGDQRHRITWKCLTGSVQEHGHPAPAWVYVHAFKFRVLSTLDSPYPGPSAAAPVLLGTSTCSVHNRTYSSPGLPGQISLDETTGIIKGCPLMERAAGCHMAERAFLCFWTRPFWCGWRGWWGTLLKAHEH